MSTGHTLGDKVILGRGIILVDGIIRIILNLGWGTYVCGVVMLVRWREVWACDKSGGRCVGWGTRVRGMLVHGVGGVCRLVWWDGGGHIFHLFKFFFCIFLSFLLNFCFTRLRLLLVRLEGFGLGGFGLPGCR